MLLLMLYNLQLLQLACHGSAMDLFQIPLLALQSVDLPSGAKPNILMLVRWTHITAGILWVGLLYFFNLVNVPFMKELDAATKGRVIPSLMPKALWWFRWASVVTVVAGIYYWMVLVGTEHRANGTPSGRIIGSFFAVWTIAFALEMGVLMMGKLNGNGWVLAIVFAIIIVAAAWSYLSINSDVQSNQVLAIGVGGGIGWFMMFNVWGIIWRMQKKIIQWTQASVAGTPMPPEAAKLSRLVFLASRANFWLSFPMLFFMNASQHYIIFGR